MLLDTNTIDVLPVAIFWKDLWGKYLGCNIKMLKLLGYSSVDEIIGKTDYGLIWADFADNLRSTDERVITSQSISTTQEQVVIANNKNTLLLTVKAPLEDERKNLTGIIGVMFDLENKVGMTELNMHLINQMVQNSTALALQQIRHDIRSPLTGIISLSQLIQTQNLQSIDKEKDQSKLIEYLGDASNSLSKFFDSLSSICQKSFLNVEQNTLFDLNDVIKNVVSMIMPSAILKNLHIDYSFDSDPLLIISNEDKLLRILTELTSNSVKYTKRGNIKIKTKKLLKDKQGYDACIRILDQGPGMPLDDLKLLNETRNFVNIKYGALEEGKGFGLKMVKSTAQTLGMKIKALKIEEGMLIELYIKSEDKKLYLN